MIQYDKDVEAKTSTVKTAITPKEFVKIWNILLSNAKKGIKEGDVFPKVLFTMESEPGLKENLEFMISRVNSDKEFQQEVSEVTGTMVSFEAVMCENSIQIVVNNK